MTSTTAIKPIRSTHLTLVPEPCKCEADQTPPVQPIGRTTMLDDSERGSGRFAVVQSIAAARKAQSVSKRSIAKFPPFRLVAIGSRQAVTNTIETLHDLGYADVVHWSKLQKGPNPGEVMSILLLREPQSNVQL